MTDRLDKGPAGAQAAEVVRLVRETFGADAVGAYLHGSAVLGGLRPYSDLDVLAVVRRRTTAEERSALVAELLGVSGGGPRPVELTIVVQSAVRPWRYPPACEFLYGEWLRQEYEQGRVPSPEPNPDLAVVLAVVLQGDAALFGPPPREVLDPVPYGDLVRATAAAVPELMAELDSDTRNVVLTLARIWTTLATGEIRTKDAAADWALARLPDLCRPVLDRARAVYLGQEQDRWDDLRAQVDAYAEHTVAEISRLAAR